MLGHVAIFGLIASTAACKQEVPIEPECRRQTDELAAFTQSLETDLLASSSVRNELAKTNLQPRVLDPDRRHGELLIGRRHSAYRYPETIDQPLGPPVPSHGPYALQRESLAASFSKARPPDGSLYVVIEPDATWKAIAAAFAAAKDVGIAALWLVVEGEPLTSAPPPSEYHEELVGLSNAKPLAAGARTPHQRIFERCPRIETLMETSRSKERDAKTTYLMSELPSVLLECRCQVDFAAVRELLFQWRGRAPVLAAIAVDLARASSTTIRLPGVTSWQDAVGKVVAAAPRVRLEVEATR